ncbi:MAG: ABC transporter ATP-binding protein [Bauldia sp.]
MSPLIELLHVRREFDDGRIVAVDDVSLTIARGEAVAIVGRSGSGKSTLLNLMCGLDVPTRGEIRFAGARISGRLAWAEIRARHIGFVFQNFCLIPTLTGRENIEVAMLGQLAGAGRRRQRASELLARLSLAGRADLHPMRLSGGERQRLAIARALANQPQVIVADEPTGSLDSETGRSVIDIIAGLNRELGTTLVIVTHDREVAAVCDRRIEMVDGRVGGGGLAGGGYAPGAAGPAGAAVRHE